MTTLKGERQALATRLLEGAVRNYLDAFQELPVGGVGHMVTLMETTWRDDEAARREGN